MSKDKIEILKPQPGKQTDFLASKAKIAIYGGGAGSGKSYALLLEAARNIKVPGARVGIFTASLQQLTAPGGLWEVAKQIYPEIGGVAEGGNKFVFPSGAIISFNCVKSKEDAYNYAGAQYSAIMFDELTHFSEDTFFYMLARLRTVTKIKPYVRCTTNPDSSSWVRDFVNWYIGEDGLPIQESSGVIRYFIKQDNDVYWYDNLEDAKEQFPDEHPMSFTFIPATAYDNPELLDTNPSYVSLLGSLPTLDRQRLLEGNWDA